MDGGALVGFFDIIQAYFTKLTGRFMMFSGRDMQLLDEWRAQGATAASVCRGIRDAVRNMDDDRPPRNLYNCRDYIEPYVERARARRVASAEDARTIELPARVAGRVARLAPPRAEDAASRALRRLEAAGAGCEREEVRAIYRRAWYSVRDLQRAAAPDDQYGALLELEAALAEEFLALLPARDRARLERAITSEARALNTRMSEEAWRHHLAARRALLLTREYGLVSLLD